MTGVGRSTGLDILSGIGSRVLWATGLSSMLRRLLVRRGRFALEFHGVAARNHPNLPRELCPVLTVRDLGKILGWIGDRFRFLTPAEFLTGETAGVLLTFDDGMANNFEVALPLLEKYSAPAIFFVATKHLKGDEEVLDFFGRMLESHSIRLSELPEDVVRDVFRGMDPEMVRKCAAHPLITVGSHTTSHPHLSRLSDQELDAEVTESKALLYDLAGQSVDYFAYPYGDYDERVMTAVFRAGYSAAFVEISKGLGGGAFEIPRIGLYSSSIPYLGAKMSGLHQLPITQRFS